MAKSEKEKTVRLKGYDELDGMRVPESWLPKAENIGGGFFVNDGVLVEYKGKADRVVIPEGITAIAEGALKGKSFSAVVIPASLTDVRPQAFRYCRYLEKLEVADGHPTLRVDGNCLIDARKKTLVMGLNNSFIPTDDGVTKIGKSAFAPNGWGRRDNNRIPENITEIGADAFAGCGVLEVVVPSSVKKLGKGAFASCDYLRTVVVEEGLTAISDEAFAYCECLTSVRLPQSVKTIGKKAFFMCQKLADVNIPSGLTDIGYAAFCWGNGWCDGMNGDFVVPKDLKLGLAALPCASINTIAAEDGNPYYHVRDNCLIETATETLVLGCKSSVIPDGVKRIGSHAFYYASGLKSAVIPDSVEEIGENAFRFCKDLESVVIPDSVKEIGKGAFVCKEEFWDKTALGKVTMPKRFAERDDLFDEGNKIKFKLTD